MSAQPGFELIPLDCPSCGAGIRAQGEDVVYYCTACRNGYQLAEENGSLRRIETSFVVAPHIEADEYRPFWILPAKVDIIDRQSKGRVLGSILGTFHGDGRLGDDGEGAFAVPAFQASLESVTRLVQSYTGELPELREKLGEHLLGGCFSRQDAEKLAHYAVMATEVARPGVLLTLLYEIEFGEPRLLGVPFYSKGGTTKDAIFGIEV